MWGEKRVEFVGSFTAKCFRIVLETSFILCLFRFGFKKALGFAVVSTKIRIVPFLKIVLLLSVKMISFGPGYVLC